MKRFLIVLSAAAAFCCCSKGYFDMDATYAGVWLGDAGLQEYCLASFDSNSDGALSMSELAAVRSMDCARRNIGKLNLEFFPNLDTLCCEDNRLVRLDLSPVPGLRYLNCSGNYLTDLNVSVTKVDKLYCCPMADPQGSNILEYVYVGRSQNIEGVTSNRSAASPKRVPDETTVIAVPD